MDRFEIIIISLLLCFLFGLIIFAIIEIGYKYPEAAEKANQICKEQGYDYYEKFERIGILSNEPVAIKCKYVDNYQDIDMNIRRLDNS